MPFPTPLNARVETRRRMKATAAGKSHIGKKRRRNEDRILLEDELGLYIVADGMGGHKAGEVASRMVVDTMVTYWRAFKKGAPPPFLVPQDKTLPDTANHLVNAIAYTNTVIHEAQKKPAYHRMGSTVAALLVVPDVLWAANVGDSRIYLFRKDRMVQISQEHSLAGEQKDQAMNHYFHDGNPVFKNLLTRVLGPQETVDVHILPIQPEPGDLIMMCSDGLTNYAEEQAIEAVLDDFSLSLERRIDVLIEEALHGGGGDNISVVLLEILPEGKWKRLKGRLRITPSS
jgi:serine/threonine protein phosphatase PrpC